MIRKKNLCSMRMLSVLCVCLTLFTSSILAQEIGSDNNEKVTLDIVHTNDIHGRSSYQEGSVIGFEKLSTYVQTENPDLIVDLGDTFHGQAFATLEEGASMAELIKAIGYDAMTPGNHDWNYGKSRLKELGELADTSILAGNISESELNYFGNNGTLVKTIDGVKVGVLGVFDQDIKAETAPRNIEGLTFANDAEVATMLATQLREEGCDIVIALSHQSYIEDFIKKTKGIDVLLAGHEHITLDETYLDADGKGVKVVESGSYFEKAGKLSIVYDKTEDKIISMNETVLDLSSASNLASDKTVSDLLDTIHQRQSQQLLQVVGTTGQALDGRWDQLRIGETSMGRFVTSAYLYETKADIAFENAGGIRLGKLLPTGNILYQDIIDTSPFGNYIVTKKISGTAVLSILEKSIDIGIRNNAIYNEWQETLSDQIRWPDDNGSYLQFGGLQVSYDTNKMKGERVISVHVGEKKLDPNEMYTVATNNYISLGKAFSELADAPVVNQFSACDEALIRFVELGQDNLDAATTKVGLQEVNPSVELPEEVKPQPIPEVIPEKENKPSTPMSPIKESPLTGEESSKHLWVAMFVSLISLFGLWSYKKTRQH